MIEMMVGLDHFSQRLIWNESSSLVDVCLRVGFAAIGFEHGQVIVEFEHGGISSGASQVPNAFRYGYSLDVRPGRSWSNRGTYRFGSGQIAHGSIDHVFIDIEFVPDEVPEIEGRVIAER